MSLLPNRSAVQSEKCYGIVGTRANISVDICKARNALFFNVRLTLLPVMVLIDIADLISPVAFHAAQHVADVIDTLRVDDIFFL